MVCPDYVEYALLEECNKCIDKLVLRKVLKKWEAFTNWLEMEATFCKNVTRSPGGTETGNVSDRLNSQIGFSTEPFNRSLTLPATLYTGCYFVTHIA